jgi:hypothetical protein
MSEANHRMKALQPEDPAVTENRLDACTVLIILENDGSKGSHHSNSSLEAMGLASADLKEIKVAFK